MYIALLLVLLGVALFFILKGIQQHQKIKTVIGGAIAVLAISFFWFMDFWGEALWYDNLGYADRFWVTNLANIGFAAAGALFGFIIMFLLTLCFEKKHSVIKKFTYLLAVVIGGFWGYSNWDVILKFWNGVSTGITDPILGKDVGFYLFSLPFYDSLYGLILSISVIAIIASFLAHFIHLQENNIFFYFPVDLEVKSEKTFSPLFFTSAVFIFLLTAGRFLSRYHLMYSNTGVVSGPGWTDVNILLPAYSVVIILLLITGIWLLVPYFRKKTEYYFIRKFRIAPERAYVMVLICPVILVIVFWFLAFTAIPMAFDKLMVEPNEITFERPYILNNIKFTRQGFALDKVIEKEYPMNGSFTQETVAQYPNIFSNIRLWDYKALEAVYKQFQTIRLYYEFMNVDVDRYKIDGKTKQVMVTAREMNIENLPEQSQTFVNKRFEYTHGYGITMAEVNEFTPQGLPHLLIKDIPPVSEYPSLEVKQPQIYFGEETRTPVVVNSKTKEFDYPSGEDNVYTNYVGKGGIELSSFWRKFLYGWKFDGTNFLFSDYPTEKSRIMFHRQILERVKLLAPFLNFDKDPYIVLSGGKLYWMVDAYTTSDYYPYSQPFNNVETIQYKEGNATQELNTQFSDFLGGINYIRNSVKAIVNTYDGTVDLYIIDNNDPIIKVWSKIYPHLFKEKSEMPKDLLAHIRYPAEMLLTQGTVYEKYHMTDPTVFYNQEDLWVRATAKYYNQIEPVEPYYIMWQVPGSDKEQFVQMLPFTPKNRQVLIGWIAGMCDPDNYGQFLAYQFPKDQMVLGPQQVETKIDQDSFLSGQLTLWDQHGSKVIRGNVLAIPVNNTLFYVEPIYLQAETAAYPELRLVVVMHNDNMSYAKTFEDAMNGLFIKSPNIQKMAGGTATQQNQPSQVTTSDNSTWQNQVKEANNAYNNYLRYTGDKKFAEAARELEKLQTILQTLSSQKK